MLTLPLSDLAWKFRGATQRGTWRTAIVPGCVHRDLLRHGLIPDPFVGTNELAVQWIEDHEWDYRTAFTASGELLDAKVVELVAEGLDTVATIQVNGREVARTDNMFTGFHWDVRPLLRRGRNELVVRFGSARTYLRTHRLEHNPREINDPVGRCTVLRKEQCQFGWDWAPRLVTAGIWRDLRLEAWSGWRIAEVRINQHHATDGSVTLEFTPELVAASRANTERGRSASKPVVTGTVSLGGRVVASIENRQSKIENPELWWPNGHGAQPLYHIELVLLEGGREIDRWSRKIGLRTLVLDRHADEWGESFQFVVNGRPLFAKGANWIPAHCFVAGLTRADYARDLRAAAEAHMNMVRVWGGGIYESDDFYDWCDELGLLVWQDFMFACTLYPADQEFQDSVRAEAEYQVRRLRHRACLALWCGNNEVFGCNATELQPAGAPARPGYDAVFHRLLPDIVAVHDGVTAYWPSSPWRGNDDTAHPAGTQRGDTHYWDVWHARHPVSDYEKWPFRFCSEFGMQAYCSEETQGEFCPPDDANVFGPTMENHQKNRFGNQIILDYISRRYRFPKDQSALVYLSQLNQAHCIETGVEFYRRSMPRCMGALYWQLNDCWPVASWSSIESTGRWRALHYAAKRFFAPALVTARVEGEETTLINNYRRSSVHAVHLSTVYDAPGAARGGLRWDLFHLDGRRLRGGRKAVALRYGESVRQLTLDLTADLARYHRDNLVLRIALDVGGRCVSEESVLLTPPRFANLPRGKTKVSIRKNGTTSAVLTFASPVFQHFFAFELPGLAHRASDNFFELFPHEPKAITVTFPQPTTVAAIRKALRHHSLVDTY